MSKTKFLIRELFLVSLPLIVIFGLFYFIQRCFDIQDSLFWSFSIPACTGLVSGSLFIYLYYYHRLKNIGVDFGLPINQTGALQAAMDIDLSEDGIRDAINKSNKFEIVNLEKSNIIEVEIKTYFKKLASFILTLERKGSGQTHLTITTKKEKSILPLFKFSSSYWATHGEFLISLKKIIEDEAGALQGMSSAGVSRI